MLYLISSLAVPQLRAPLPPFLSTALTPLERETVFFKSFFTSQTWTETSTHLLASSLGIECTNRICKRFYFSVNSIVHLCMKNKYTEHLRFIIATLSFKFPLSSLVKSIKTSAYSTTSSSASHSTSSSSTTSWSFIVYSFTWSREKISSQIFVSMEPLTTRKTSAWLHLCSYRRHLCKRPTVQFLKTTYLLSTVVLVLSLNWTQQELLQTTEIESSSVYSLTVEIFGKFNKTL